MPIIPFLNGERFDQESKRVLGLSLEMVCIALRTGDCDDDVKQAIATKLVALAKAGELNPDILCEQVLKDIRSESAAPADVRSPSPRAPTPAPGLPGPPASSARPPAGAAPVS
jgi:hypothetical protein